eukprot:6204514-Pleurochrysis_carterae.AAC.1
MTPPIGYSAANLRCPRASSYNHKGLHLALYATNSHRSGSGASAGAGRTYGGGSGRGCPAGSGGNLRARVRASLESRAQALRK